MKGKVFSDMDVFTFGDEANYLSHDRLLNVFFLTNGGGLISIRLLKCYRSQLIIRIFESYNHISFFSDTRFTFDFENILN